MIKVPRVLPECYSDTLLVELILQRGNVGHRKGISKVLKALVDHERDNEFIIGVVDTDKFKRDKDNPNLRYFHVFHDKIRTEGLLILRKPNTEKYLIRIHPEFEPWIWDRALECDLNPGDFGFGTFEDLLKASKNNEVSEDQNMKQFIKAVIQKNPPAIKTLREWLVKALPPADQEIILAMVD